MAIAQFYGQRLVDVVVRQHQVPHPLRRHHNSNPINNRPLTANRSSSRQHLSGSPTYQVG